MALRCISSYPLLDADVLMVDNRVNEWIPNNIEMMVRVLLRYDIGCSRRVRVVVCMCVSLAFIPTLDTAICSAHVYPKYTAKRTTSNTIYSTVLTVL